MSTISEIEKLRNRVKSFIEINEKVDLQKLKIHLECKQTELLLAIGGLVSEGKVELEEEGWKVLIKRFNGKKEE